MTDNDKWGDMGEEMKRKRFIKLLMGQFGYDRNKAHNGANVVAFRNKVFAFDPDRPTYESMYTVLLIIKGKLLE